MTCCFTKKIFLIFFVLIFLSGCIPTLDARWKSVQDSKQISSEMAKKACTSVRGRSLQLASVRALYDMEVDTGGAMQSLRMSMAFKAPDKLRLELLPPSAALAVYLGVSSATSATFMDLTQKKVSYASESSELVKKLFRVSLPAEDLAYILTARVPARLLNRLCPVDFDGNSKDADIQYLFPPDGAGVTIVDKELGQLWTVNLGSGLLRTALLRKGIRGWPVLSADFYEDEFSDPQTPTPKEVSIVLDNFLASAYMHSTVSKVNAPIPANVFEIRVPAGFAVDK